MLTTRQWSIVGLCFGLLLALELRVHNLDTLSLWNDEGNTVITARNDWGWTIAQALDDAVHPPLFFFVEKLNLTLLGESEFSLRWLAAMLGVVGVAALSRLLHEWSSEVTLGNWGALLLAVSPLAIWYSREARMYSLLLLLNISVMFWFGRLIQLTDGLVVKPTGDAGSRVTGAKTASMTVFGVLSASLYLVHYFGLLTPLVQFVYILVTFRRNHHALWRWTLLQALAALPIGGWLYLQFTHGITLKISWIQPVTAWTLWNTWLLYTVGGVQVWQVSIGLLFGLVVLLGLRVSPVRWRWLLGLWLGLPAIVTLTLSLWRSLYVDRYLIGSLAPLLVLAAVGLKRLWHFNRWGGGLVTVALFGSLAWQATLGSHQQPEDWRGAVRYLLANEQPADQFVRRSIYYWTVDYYYTGQLKIESLDGPQPSQPSTLGSQRLWLMFLAKSVPAIASPADLLTDLSQQSPDLETQQWLESIQPFLTDSHQFGNVILLLYDFSRP